MNVACVKGKFKSEDDDDGLISQFQTDFKYLKRAVLFIHTYIDTQTVKHIGCLASLSVVLYYLLNVRPVSEGAAGLVCKQHGVRPTCFCTLLTGPVRLIRAKVR